MTSLLRAAAADRRLALLLDFDGTLVSIRKSPGAPVLSRRRRRLLQRLAERFPTAIVTGRSLADVRLKVGLKDVCYVGNHGLEIAAGQRIWVHPAALRLRPSVSAALRAVKRATSRIPGVQVEDKGLTGSVHFRRVPALLRPSVRRIVETEVAARRRRVRTTAGKMVLEVRPAVGWDKGRGVMKLLALLRGRASSRPLYIGDDATDESAFEALAPAGLTVAVGRRPGSAAKFRLKDVDSVWRFLESLLESRSGQTSRGTSPSSRPSGEQVQTRGLRDKRKKESRILLGKGSKYSGKSIFFIPDFSSVRRLAPPWSPAGRGTPRIP